MFFLLQMKSHARDYSAESLKFFMMMVTLVQPLPENCGLRVARQEKHTRRPMERRCTQNVIVVMSTQSGRRRITSLHRHFNKLLIFLATTRYVTKKSMFIHSIIKGPFVLYTWHQMGHARALHHGLGLTPTLV